jgi:urease accessory protein UreF
MESIQFRMKTLLGEAVDEPEVAGEEEVVDEKDELWQLALAIAVVAKSQGITEPDKLVGMLKQLGMAKKTLIEKAIKKVAVGAKAQQIHRGMKAGLK